MVRTFACALAVLALVVGTAIAADKDKKAAAKGKSVAGNFWSYKNGKLTLRVVHRGKVDDGVTNFDVAADTKAMVFKERIPPEKSTASAALAGAKKDDPVRLRLDESGKVLLVIIGGRLFERKTDK